MSALSSSDWITIAAIVVPVVGSSLAVVIVTARKTGAFEAKFGQVVDDVKVLMAANADRNLKLGEFSAVKAMVAEHEVKLERMPAFDTAIQLLTQSMTTLQNGFVDFRKESREARKETNAAITASGREIKGELQEVRHQVNNFLTGKIVPAKRPAQRAPRK